MELKIFDVKSEEYKKALALRDNILRKPLGLKFTVEELSKDIGDVHMGLFEGDRVVACLTLTLLPNGKVKMRQVAVDDKMQKRGLGTQLSVAAEEYARDRGFVIIFCHARKVAVPFYLKLGYKRVGDEFTEVSIPHYLMEKKL